MSHHHSATNPEKHTRRALFAVRQLDNVTFDLPTYKKQKPYIHNKQQHETKYTVDATDASQRERFPQQQTSSRFSFSMYNAHARTYIRT